MSNVVFLGRQDKSLMPRIWSLCDLSVVHLRDTELFRSVIPSKIFESFAMGLPVLMGVPEGEATGIVAREQAGMVIPPQDVNAMVAAIETLADNAALMVEYRENALAAAPRYDRKALAGDMLESLKKLL